MIQKANPQGDIPVFDAAPSVPDLSDDERRNLIESLGHEIAEWSEELNRRLA